jgi:hypothetical protein
MTKWIYETGWRVAQSAKRPLTIEIKSKNNYYVLNRQAICFRFSYRNNKDNNYKIIATKVAKELVKDDSLAWIAEEEAISLLKQSSEVSLYSNSENALAWIDQLWRK